VTRSILNLPPGSVLSRGVAPSVAISPDGRTVAYVAHRDGTPGLYLRALEDLEAKAVPGTESATTAFFSPDGNWIGFQARAQFLKVPVSGGAPALLAGVAAPMRGASWGDDGSVVFSVTTTTGLSQVDADGGETAILTQTDRERREKTHRLAEVLPGSEAVLFTLGTGDIATFDEASIAVFSRDTGTYWVLVEGGSSPRYSASGHLLYARAGELLAVPFDKDKLRIRGTPVTVVEDIATSPIYGHAEFALSRNGTLVYARGGAWGNRHRVVWVDRDGRVEPLIEEERAYAEVSISPDGRSLALSIEGANTTLWIYDIARGALARLSAGFDNDYPVWTPDGSRLAFRSNRTGSSAILWQRGDGSGGAEELLQGEGLAPQSWSPDGRAIAYVDRFALWVGSLGDDGGKARVSVDGSGAQFSPDGRWLAYSSNESGRFEIYLRPYPDLGRKWQVSTDGGAEPRFRRDGRELFYRNGDKLMSVAIEAAGEPVRQRPTVLFEKRFALATFFDVASDGRFIFIEDVATQGPPTELVLVQNFFAELDRLVPTR
jgi:serine/threonine-protein kinase